MTLSRRRFLRLAVGGTVGAAAASGLTDLVCGPRPAAGAQTGRGITALTGGTVIDATGTAPQRPATVLCARRRILAVGRPERVPVPPGAREINCRGKFIIPGLWDMHVHTPADPALLEELYLPLYLANGVTGIREMWGFPAHHQIRARIRGGELVGPHWVLASPLIDGPGSVWPGATEVHDADEARAAVRRAKADGADFVKVYSFLSPESYAAIVDEASRQEIPFAGHLPYRVPAREAAAAGQRSFEHLISLFIATSRPEARYQPRLAALPFDPARPRQYVTAAGDLERAAVADHDRRRAAALFDRFVAQRTAQCPTFSVLRLFSAAPEALAEDPRLRYVPAATKAYWERSMASRGSATPEQRAAAQRLFDAQLHLVGDMAAAGVGLLAGTDCGNPYTFSGFSLHDELAFLVRAGLSPLRALQAATRDAARHLGLGRAAGTVTAGASADLVVLDADPLAEIGNTRRIDTVVVAGVVLDRARRSALLAAAEERAGAEDERHPPPSAPAATGGCPCHDSG